MKYRVQDFKSNTSCFDLKISKKHIRNKIYNISVWKKVTKSFLRLPGSRELLYSETKHWTGVNLPRTDQLVISENSFLKKEDNFYGRLSVKINPKIPRPAHVAF